MAFACEGFALRGGALLNQRERVAGKAPLTPRD
jgi:hypothetical protein